MRYVLFVTLITCALFFVFVTLMTCTLLFVRLVTCAFFFVFVTSMACALCFVFVSLMLCFVLVFVLARSVLIHVYISDLCALVCVFYVNNLRALRCLCYVDDLRALFCVCYQGPVSRKSRYLYGPEIKYSNRKIKNKSAGPGLQTTPFCFINWQFYHVRCKTIETSIFSVNGDSLPGPLIIGTFEKRAPGPKKVVRWNERVRTKPCDAVDWDQIKFSFLLKFVFPSENNLIIQK